MSTTIDEFSKYLHGGANPIEELINQPKHQAKGALTFSRPDDTPLEDDDLPPAPPKVNPYTKPLSEIEEEMGTGEDEEGPITVKLKTINYAKQSSKIILIADKVQAFVFGLIADVEDIDDFKFTADEKEELELLIPDFAEENGIQVSNNLAMALSLILMLLKRAKRAWKLRKAAKLAKALPNAA